MSENHSRRPSSQKSRDIRKVRSFIEEFSWLLASYSNVDFRAIPEVLAQHEKSFSAAHIAMGSYASSNPNKHFLVGALPRLLKDNTLFPQNADIAEFAASVMDVHIPRHDKRSKYELIGLIVCETEHLNDANLDKLVSALAAITDGDSRTKSIIKQRKQQNFEWNAIIQELAATRKNE